LHIQRIEGAVAINDGPAGELRAALSGVCVSGAVTVRIELHGYSAVPSTTVF
jgi:hypothetical protein